MTEERLKEIKDSIDLQLEACKIFKQDNELTLEELELYNEVIRLKKIIDKTQEYIEKKVICFKQGNLLCELNVDDLLNILKQNNLTLEQLTGVENE